MEKIKWFETDRLSAAEYAALSLMAVACAATAVLVNKYLALPQAFFIAVWCSVVVLLSLALARSISDAWNVRNVPAKIFIVFLIACVFLSALKPTSTGFFRHDEIYSWGMWGVQHALGDSADYYYTGAAYPQLFSYEIASVFLAQGSHIPHFFAKLMVGLPSLLIIIVLGEFTAKSQRSWVNWLTLLLSIGSVASIANLLFWAYADPLASALLVTSLALILQYAQRRKLRLMVLASACAAMAALTKQPGLVWCIASLPAMLFYGVWRLGWKKEVFFPCILAMILAVIWPIFLAPSFVSNQGVMDIVRNNGGIVESIVKSFGSYIIKSPGTGFILFLPVLFAFKSRPIRLLWLFFVFPYLTIWFAFGSYEARHGMHVILVSVLLVTHALTLSHARMENSVVAVRSTSFDPKNWLRIFSLLLVFSSIVLAYSRNAHALKDGNRAMFVSQFGIDAVDVFDDLIIHQRPVFTTSNYQYGLLFNRNPLHRLAAGEQDFSVVNLKRYLLQSQSEYVLSAGDWDYGPIAGKIQDLAKICPDAVQLVKTSTVQGRFTIYKVDKLALMSVCHP